MNPEVRSERKNVTVHKAVFHEKDLHDLVARTLGCSVGVPWRAPWVRVHIYSSTHQEGSLGTSKPCVHIELTVDHDKEPAEARKKEQIKEHGHEHQP
ncbi:MAG: hypothetical protein E2593_06970 [Stenotrophomonas sp.]|nr:hypothetical protein [Stenotrophomonas sp.]